MKPGYHRSQTTTIYQYRECDIGIPTTLRSSNYAHFFFTTHHEVRSWLRMENQGQRGSRHSPAISDNGSLGG